MLSVIACILVGSWERELRKFDFERLAETRCLLFENKANRHLDELKALGRFYDGSQFVDRDEFIQFTAPALVNHPEIDAFGWAPRITHANRSDFERALQVEGLANCNIHDGSHLGDTAVAPAREEYYPVLYHLPQLDWAMGLDMFSKPSQRKAIERARDLDQSTITGPILIPCEQSNKLAVIAYRPVYEKDLPISTIEERRAAIKGVVFSAVRVIDILTGIIWKQDPRGTDIQVIDLSSPPGEQFLCQHWARLRNWETSDSLLKIDNSTNLRYVTSFKIADRTWEIRCTPSPGYLDAYSLWIQWIILLGGLALTALVVSQLMLMRNRASFVETLVDERTAALRESEECFRAVFETAKDSVFIKDNSLRYTQVNPTMERLFELSVFELIGRTDEDIFGTEAGSHIREVDSRVLGGETVEEEHTKPIQGVQITFHTIKVPMYDTSGKIIGLCGIARDITERKQAERALRESESIYRSTIENASGVPYQFDLASGKYVFVGAGIENLIGIAQKEFSPQAYSEIIMEQVVTDPDGPEDHATYGEVFRRGETAQYRADVRIQTSSGDVKWISDYAVPIRDDSGQVVGSIGILLDITERKRAEEAIRESKIKLQVLYDSSSDSIMLLDEKGFFDCNDATLRLFGCATKEEFCNRHPADFSPPTQPDGTDSMSYAKNNIALAIKEGSARFEHLHRRLDGTDFPAQVLLDKMELNGKEVLQARVFDITERKRAETLLQAERDYSSNIIQSMPGLSYVIEKDSGLLQSRNDNWAQVTGYSEEELQLMAFLDFFEEGPERDKCARRMQEVYDKGWSSMENLLVTKEGMKTPYYFTGRRVVIEGRTYLIGLGIDITECKQVEDALKKSESQYDELFSSLLEGIVVVDENEKVTFCNPACASIFEEDDPEKMIGKSLLDYADSDQKEIILQQTACRLRGESSKYELEITTAKNNRRILLVSVSPRLDENGRYIGAFGNVIDITETRRLRALESRAERLETAGKIAGQVAHDFNNLLAPLMAYPDMIRDELPDNHPALIYLDDIENAAERISDINQDLLAMGRRGHYNQEVINLNRIVSHAVNVIDTRSGTISCETDLCDDLMNVMGGAAQIDRCISNLLCNAQDALHGVGTITVKTKNYYVDDVSIVYGRVPKGEYVKVIISDTGCGIPDDIIQKIFDPFFTSKTADKKRGSGLGLSVVDAVMKDHNGYLDLSSNVGGGTSFYLYFPITRKTADEQESVQIVGGTETILIIDDDEVQRDVSTRILKKLGYAVSAVESGEKAIEFLKDNPQDLLILDMIMPPGIDGAETYRLISRIHPGQKAIIVSGFAESGLVLWAQALGAGAYVRKPFTKATIGAAIRTELDRVKLQPA